MLNATAQGLAQDGAMGGAMDVTVQAFAAWAAQHEGAAVQLGLSSHGLLMWADEVVDLPSGSAASRAQSLRERAIERWTHYLDLPTEGFDAAWQVQTTLDQGPAPVALACAVPRSLCDGLQEVARRHGVRLLSIQPWWAQGLQQAWQRLTAFPTDEPGQAMHCWAWQEGAWQTQARVRADAQRWVLRSLAFVADTGETDELALAASDPMPEVIAEAPTSALVTPMPPQPSPSMRQRQLPQLRLTTRASTDWAESLNFAGPRVRTSFWSWALLALGAIALVHALELAAQVDEAQAAAQAQWSRLQDHVQARAPRPVQAMSTASAASAASAAPAGSPAERAPLLQTDAWRSAAQLAAWLGHPWAEALDHSDVSAQRRGIALTRFQLDLSAWGTHADQPLSWRLQGVAPDDTAAWAWVQDLGPHAELRRRDALAQPVPVEGGTLTWRIDVSIAGEQP